MAKKSLDKFFAGWWQIRHALGDVNLAKEMMAELKTYHVQLREKILPEITRYGIL